MNSFGAEPADDRIEEDRAGDREVGAAWIHARRGEPLFEVGFDEVLPQPVERLRADAQVAEILGLAVLGCGHQPQAEDRAGGSDHAIEALADDLIDVGAHLAVEVLDQPPFVAAGERVTLDEPFGQPDDADLEAAAERQVGGRCPG